jgi:hypothetical protein
VAGPLGGLNTWHHVSASYSYKTRQATLKIDKGPKLISPVGEVVAGYTGPAHLFFGQGGPTGPTSVNRVAVDSVVVSAK